MKSKDYISELKLNLPDFITNRIHDKELINEIKSLIEENPEFRDEYFSLRKTLGFVENTEFPSPEESYFSSLSARINEKLDSSLSANENFNFIDWLFRYKYVLLPSAAVFVIAVILFTNVLHKSNTESGLSNTSEKNTNEIQNTEKTVLPDSEIAKPEFISDSSKKSGEKRKQNHKELNKDFAAVELQFSDSLKSFNAGLNESTGNDIDTDIFSEADDVSDEETDAAGGYLFLNLNSESDPDEEFEKLTTEEQQEIINNLLNSNI